MTRAGNARSAYFSPMLRPPFSHGDLARHAWLALAAGLLLGCADTNAPPPAPLELLLVVNRQSNSLSIVSVDGTDAPTSVALGGSGSTPLKTRAAGREALENLQTGSPWLDLGGNGLPWTFAVLGELGATLARLEPTAPSKLSAFSSVI